MMGVYAVRVSETLEAVGVFYVARLSDLFDAVDECTNPNVCEYRKLPPGSVYWPKPGSRIWAPEAEEFEPEIKCDVAETSGDWHETLFGPGKWKPVP